MLLILVLCAIFAGVKGYNTTSVGQCVLNQGELPLNAYVEGCTTPPCVLAQGTDVVVHVIFKSPRLLNEVQTLATAIVTLVIPFNIEYNLNENARTCNFLTNTYCPLLPEEVVQYTLKMHIESFFPVDVSNDVNKSFNIALRASYFLTNYEKFYVNVYCLVHRQLLSSELLICFVFPFGAFVFQFKLWPHFSLHNKRPDNTGSDQSDTWPQVTKSFYLPTRF